MMESCNPMFVGMFSIGLHEHNVAVAFFFSFYFDKTVYSQKETQQQQQQQKTNKQIKNQRKTRQIPTIIKSFQHKVRGIERNDPNRHKE